MIFYFVFKPIAVHKPIDRVHQLQLILMLQSCTNQNFI